MYVLSEKLVYGVVPVEHTVLASFVATWASLATIFTVVYVARRRCFGGVLTVEIQYTTEFSVFQLQKCECFETICYNRHEFHHSVHFASVEPVVTGRIGFCCNLRDVAIKMWYS